MTALRQDEFDPLGPPVRTKTVASGRRVRYIDEGEPGWIPLLWFGGGGTSVRAFRLLEFARSLRLELQVRVISVERNGLGETPFDPALGFREYAGDVWSLLDELGVESASAMAISGGGPYAAHVAASAPARVRSLHLACTISERLDRSALPPLTEIAADPAAWWRYPPSSPVHLIPGFDESTVEEATAALFARGRDVAPEGLAHAITLYETEPLPDLAQVSAPAFLYWGSADRVVSLDHLGRWQDALVNVVRARVYDGEGHDVQYRHWDQILADVVYLGERVVLSRGGRTLLVDEAEAERLLLDGATLGLAAWSAVSAPPAAALPLAPADRL